MNEFQQPDERARHAPTIEGRKRRYEAPIVESGDAFERVQLASGCSSGIFDNCEIPCDE